MRAWDLAKRYAVKTFVAQLAGLLGRADRKTLIRLTQVCERLAPYQYQKRQLAWIRQLFETDHPGTQFALRVLRELNPKIRNKICLLYTSPSPRDLSTSRMPSSA